MIKRNVPTDKEDWLADETLAAIDAADKGPMRAFSSLEEAELALPTLIAIRRQPAAVERIIERTFSDEQLDRMAIHYPAAESAQPQSAQRE